MAEAAETTTRPTPSSVPDLSHLGHLPLVGVDPHVVKANAYIEGVLSGKIPACRYTRLACARQKRDLLDRFKDHPLYYFDDARAGRICRFVERLPHIKGPKANAGELIHLEPWQCFILTTVFGWFRKDTGGRRFGKAYSEVPRGNGKSPLSSGVAIYGLTSEDEQGAEIYSAATTRDQARIVFGDAQKMLRKRQKLADRLGVVINKFDIQQPRSNSIFVPLSRDAGAQDGQNIAVAVIDEFHAHKTRDVYDVIETGCQKRPSSLLWIITTAGKNTAGICYEVRSYVVKILEGVIEDESQFGVIYTVDEGDDPYALATWVKANPNWGVSVQPDKFASIALKAQHLPAARNNFLTKHLNVWCNADLAWMDMAAWDRCADPTLDEVSFAGEECTIGLDLASTTDITAKAKLFCRDVPEQVCTSCGHLPARHPARVPPKNGEPGRVCEKAEETQEEVRRHYYLFVTSYLPEATIHEGRNAQYEGWAEEGWIKATDGEVTDFEAVKSDILLDRDENRITELGYDPWQCAKLANELTAEGITAVEVRPNVQNLSAPMKFLDAIVRQGRLHHRGEPCMRWQMSNVVAKEDAAGNLYPRKERPENKIDGPVASITAVSRAMLSEPTVGSYLENEPLLTL